MSLTTSTVGYPSDSWASCYIYGWHTSRRHFHWQSDTVQSDQPVVLLGSHRGDVVLAVTFYA